MIASFSWAGRRFTAFMMVRMLQILRCRLVVVVPGMRSYDAFVRTSAKAAPYFPLSW